MAEDIEENFVFETAAFIEQNERWLESTISSVGWSAKDLAALIEASEPEYVCCPVNLEHRMPASSLESHLMKCEKSNASYPNVLNLELSTTLQHTDTVFKLESDHDSVREWEMFGPTAAKASSSQTLAELLKAERDARRRRAAHRGKRVHSNKKSYNEVMREVIANQMLTIGDTVANDEGCPTDSKTNNQEPAATNFSFLGIGSRYYRGNPHKRWLTIEREEEETMAEMQKQSARREEDRYQRYPRHDDDRRYSRRDRRDDSDRHRASSKRDHDHRRDESRYGESRKENRVRVGDDRQSRHDEAGRNRGACIRASDTRDLKRNESKKVTDHDSREHRERRQGDRRDNPDSTIDDEVVSSKHDHVNRGRRDHGAISDARNSERDEQRSRKRRGTRQADHSEDSDLEEYVSKREPSFRRSKESSDGEKKKKKKKKHKHKKKHKKDSKSD